MKVCFEKETGIPKLTTIECQNMLSETRHHTDFLDNLKKDIANFCCKTIKMLTTYKVYKYSTVYDVENQYFEKLLISFEIIQCKDFSNKKNNKGAFYTEGDFVNGKLFQPELDLLISVGKNGEFSEVWLETIIDHEINHMYDNWQWQSTGHQPLINNAEWNHGDGRFINENMGRGDRLLKSIAWCIYLALWTETNAYVNQAYKEFGRIGLTDTNIHKKLKTTVSYQNYSKSINTLNKELGKISEEELQKRILKVFADYGRISIPKPKKDSDYKDILKKWGDSIYNKFLKRYCGIASLYLERLNHSQV